MLTPHRVAAFALAATVLVGAAGCGKAAEKATEKAIEDQIGADADVDLGPDGEVKIKTDEGSYTADGDGNLVIEDGDGSYRMSTGAAPDGWPADVELPDLDIETGGDMSSIDEVTSSIIATSTLDVAELVDHFDEVLREWDSTDRSTGTSDGFEHATVRYTSGDRYVQLSVAADASEDHRTVSITHGAPPED